MKKLFLKTSIAATMLAIVSACTIVRPGHVGIRTHLGKMNPEVLQPGAHGVNPFVSRVQIFSTQVVEYSENLHLPTKEGLEITAEVTLLSRIMADSVPFMYQRFGDNYNHALVINTYIATAREITAKFFAKDLITQREELEKEIHEKLVASLSKYGIIIEAVLIRDIELPQEIVTAIQDKVRAEQAAFQVQFDIEKKRKELDFSIESQRKNADFAIEKQNKDAERMIIDANAIRRSQAIIDSSLTETQLRYKALEISRGLVTSPNTKLVITDGKSPVILNPYEAVPTVH